MPAQLVPMTTFETVSRDAETQPGATVVQVTGQTQRARGRPSSKQPLQQELEPLNDSSSEDESRDP